MKKYLLSLLPHCMTTILAGGGEGPRIFLTPWPHHRDNVTRFIGIDPQFHQHHIEGLGYRGMKFGDALDFYQTDISIEGPNPVLPSGGNIGSGRSRFWMHTDCIQQLQGRAGARQVKGVKPEIAVSGGPMPMGGNFTVWSATPD